MEMEWKQMDGQSFSRLVNYLESDRNRHNRGNSHTYAVTLERVGKIEIQTGDDGIAIGHIIRNVMVRIRDQANTHETYSILEMKVGLPMSY